MKKIIFVIIFLIFNLNLIACNTIPYRKINLSNKNLVYLEELKNLKLEKVNNIKIIENKFYKEQPVKKDDFKIFLELFQMLDQKNNILSLDSDLEYLYKIQIVADDKIFFIDVYGNNIISIYPFDGINPKNFLCIDDIPLSLQAESICKYILNKQ
ncbi:MAG: DUF4883 family protein [Sarcina sp.]